MSKPGVLFSSGKIRVRVRWDAWDAEYHCRILRPHYLHGEEKIGEEHVHAAADAAVLEAGAAERRPDLLGGVWVVKGTAPDGKPLLAVPFYALANRAKSSQEVWAVQAGLRPDASWWEGRLYRPAPRERLKP